LSEIGPFTPGFSGDLSTIQQLDELGVIILLFDVGLHFFLAAEKQLSRARAKYNGCV
jgi:predicted Kef-type K+ transport protein